MLGNLGLKKGEEKQKVVHYSVDFVQKTSVLIKVVTQLSQSKVDKLKHHADCM